MDKITSSDGSGDYIESLRTLYLYDAAAERGGPFPGSQAGVADLFNFSQDHQDWFPAGYWFWNLRMQVQANLSAGEASLNDPIFNLYQSNVSNISAWTSSRMPGRSGLCVPETMRFNGNGYYFGGESNASCDSTIAPTYNSLTLTSGAEIGLWVWQTYLTNDSRSFLAANYPLMSGAARFLLSAAATGSGGADMIGLSTQPTATRHNSENLGLEAVWPYGLIGDNSSLTALAKRTYTSRSYVNANDWTFDSLQAARLGLASEVQADLLAATKSYQVYPSGLAGFGGAKGDEPYVEQAGAAAAAVSEALAADYDGLLRIAPAWPGNWTGEGTVYIQHNTTVDVQVSSGTPATVAIVSGTSSPISMRTPWPGQAVTVVDGSTGATVVASQANATFSIPVQAGRSYLVELTASPATSLPFASISGSPATSAKHLGNASIGLDSTGATSVISLRAHANGMYVTADNAGASPLIANRTAIGPWEEFDLIHD
jgi:hypothetical protein